MYTIDTAELKAHIFEEMESIQDLVNLNKLNFCKNHSGSDDGTYVFSDQQGYHFVYSERGSEMKHKVTDNLFEITFWAMNFLIRIMAIEIEDRNISKVKDQRQYLFEQELLLFDKVRPNYKKLAEIHIDEILREYP